MPWCRAAPIPSYAQGYYKRDNAFYKAWDAIARDRDSFLAWMKENVLEQGPEDFAAHARKRCGGGGVSAMAEPTRRTR